MFTAQKGNKVLKIESAEVKQYRALGFDIYEGDKLLRHGHGKTVPYAKYEELKAELEQAKAELELARFELESVEAELKKARAELKALRGLIETQAEKKRAPAEKPAKK